MTDPFFTPDVLAGADQELAQTRTWLRSLADLHPRAVEELGALEAVVGLAAHIRSRVKQGTKEPENANGWGIAAIAVALLSEHLHPPAEPATVAGLEKLLERELTEHAAPRRMPPIPISVSDPDFVPRVVQALLDPASQTACGEHPRSRFAPAYPCCDNCPDQGDD